MSQFRDENDNKREFSFEKSDSVNSWDCAVWVRVQCTALALVRTGGDEGTCGPSKLRRPITL